MKSLENFELKDWNSQISPDIKNKAVQRLEEGKVLYFPSLPFALIAESRAFFHPKSSIPK